MAISRPKSKQTMPSGATRVFKGIVFDAYQWRQKMFDGSMQMFEKLKRADTVVVIPVLKNGKILVSRQEQPGKKIFNGLLGGRLDEGEDPLAGAKRELKEESGYVSDDWVLFDSVQPVSKIDWAVYTFIAKSCVRTGEPELDAGEKIKLRQVSFAEFIKIATQKDFEEMELKIRVLEAIISPQKMKSLKRLLYG